MELAGFDLHAWAVLAIAGATFWLFARDAVPLQTSALLSILALMLLFGVLPYDGAELGPERFLAGFGHPALVTICCLMLLGRGLVATGALEPAARGLAALWARWPWLALLAMLLFCMAVSGVLNDTPLVILMIPMLASVAARTGTHPATTLLPMNYAVIIGGMATTIGTSTNLLVVGIAEDLGVRPIGIFEFLPVVAVAAALALPYLWLVAPRLLAGVATAPAAAATPAEARVLVTEDAGLGPAPLTSRLFAERHGVRVLRLHRPADDGFVAAAEAALRAGDVLVVSAPQPQLDALRGVDGVLLLDSTLELPHTQRAPLALAIMAGVIGLAAAKVLPMVIAAALGVAAMMLTRCLRWQDAGEALSSKVILVVVASLALGEAMTATGLIAAAGRGIAALGAELPAWGMVAALMLAMAVVTNFVSNNAAAIIGTPVAVEVARLLGVDPLPLVLAVLFGCNLCFATPMGYQTNLLVMSAAGYRFADFVRVGLPLTLGLWLVLSWLLADRYLA